LVYRGSPAGDEIVVHHSEVVWDQPRKTNGIRFVGERGELFVDRSVMISKPDSIIKQPLSVSEHKLYKSPGHRENWMQCVRDRRRPICDVEVGARSVTVCHLVNLAYWHGKKLEWNPRTWEFTGDNAAEANKWRERERREKYPLPSIA
jgi:hypothetical protein